MNRTCIMSATIQDTQIMCAEPRIIINPVFFEKLRKDELKAIIWNNVLNEREHFQRYDPDAYKRIYSPRKKGITQENISDYAFCTKDGDMVPMYISVPCGKCILCRNHRSQEWQCRAMAETVTSTNIPLFVTLTYEHEPEDGVNKRDLQLFLKRLRKNLSANEENLNLRYFAVSEYGSHTHRPHYHLILWNYPKFRLLSDVLHDLEKAWQLGFVYVKACSHGAISYVMKYMRKEANVPKGKNELFFLSSRRPGIGAYWIDQNKEFFRLHPEQVQLSLCDPFTGMVLSFFLPRYFKDRISPTTSKYLPRPLITEYKKFFYNSIVWSELYRMMGVYSNAIEFAVNKVLNRFVRPVLEKYKQYFGWTDLPRDMSVPNILRHDECYADGTPKDISTIDRLVKSIPELEFPLLHGLYRLPRFAMEKWMAEVDEHATLLDIISEDRPLFGKSVNYSTLKSIFDYQYVLDKRVDSVLSFEEYFHKFYLEPLLHEIVISAKMLLSYDDKPTIFKSYEIVRGFRQVAYDRLFSTLPKIDIAYRVMDLSNKLAEAETREFF